MRLRRRLRADAGRLLRQRARGSFDPFQTFVSGGRNAGRCPKATSDCIHDCFRDNAYPGLNLGAHEGRMSHSDDVSIRRFREPDLCQLVRLISETIGISYAEVYPPRAVQFFKDFHSEKKIAHRGKTGTTLVVEKDGELVATGSLVDGEILAVFVHPRLQKGGRGKALMKALEPRERRGRNWAQHLTALKEV